MKITPEKQAERIAATQEAAAAFVADITHMRAVLSRPQTDREELRRLSAILRRLLVDGDLQSIAGPRIGKWELQTYDLRPIYRSGEKAPFAYFESAGVTVFGITFSVGIIDNGSSSRDLPDYVPEKIISLSLENFLKQKILCLKGEWVTRLEAIKFIAHIASGVHSGTAQEAIDRTINRIRHVASYSLEPLPPELGEPPGTMAAGLNFNIAALSDAELPFAYDPKKVDPVLVEMLATAHLLTISPNIVSLEACVKQELGI